MNAATRLTITAAVATALAAISLYPLFTHAQWFLSSLGAVAVVTAASEATRRLSAPALLGPLTAVLALLCYLTAIFAGHNAVLGFLPGPEALRQLQDLAARGFEDIQSYAAPVPAIASITLVTTGSVGLTAILVDLLAVRARKAAVAGLPLLAMFSVTSAIQSGAGWLPFICAAAGFCALLMADADEQVSRWGRRVAIRRRGTVSQAQPSRPVDTGTMSSSGRRIGFAAIVIGVLVPAAIPTLPGRAAVSGWLAGLGQGGGGTPAIRAPSPMADLQNELSRPSDETVLRYTTKDSSPGYLRLYALSQFDGRAWKMGPPVERRRTRELPDGKLAEPPGTDNVQAKRVTTRVSVSRKLKGLQYLPLPYPTRQVDIAGQWRYDPRSLMVFSRGDVAGGRSFEVTSWDLRPERQRLHNAGSPPADTVQRYLDLPEDLPDIVRDHARRITENADTAYGKAMALQEWFTEPGRFSYSLDAQLGRGSSALVSFLEERVGYCEHFASAMAVMARVLDVPARVAVGYTAGTEVEQDTWEVSTHDAHAWPELYFEGIGWLRFEPTPAASGQPTATVPDYAQPSVETPGTSDPDTSTAGPEPSSAPSSTVGAGESPAGQRLDGTNSGGVDYGSGSRSPIPPALIIAVLVLLLLGFVPAGTRRVIRWRRWAVADSAVARARAAWLELRDDARDLGLPWEAAESPRAVARRLRFQLLSAHPDDEPGLAALTRVTMAEERARYARTPGEFGSLRDDSRVLRRSLRGSVARPRRWAAATLPRSALQMPQRVSVAIAEGLNWADGLGSRVRAWVRHRTRRAAS